MALERGQCAIYDEQSFLQIPVFLVSNYHLATVKKKQPIPCFDKMEIWCFDEMFGSSAQHPPGSTNLGRER